MRSAWIDVRAEGRAVALSLEGIRPRGGLAEVLGGSARPVFDFLLGLRSTAEVPEQCVEPLADVVRSLNFRMAAGIKLVRRASGVIAQNPDAEPVGRGISQHEYALLDGAQPVCRQKLGRARLLLVLSTAGRPKDVRNAVVAHFDVIRDYGHRDVALVIADDAADAASTAELDIICADARRTYGFEVARFSEWNADGTAGEKQRFRAQIAAKMATAREQRTVWRIFAPGLAGTANAIFARFVGHDIVWLEQDAIPYAIATSDHISDSGFVDLMGGALLDTEHYPVDVLHVVDRLLHAAEFEVSVYEDHRATYEDTGFEEFGPPSPHAHGSPGMVHFHTCGHPDFRARFSHQFVLDQGTPVAERMTFLAGGLPIMRAFTEAPQSVSLRRWSSAFGTVVGFSASGLPGPPTMWATPVRLVDLAVGDLVQAFGVPGCIAGTALRHTRGEVTGSGRGELAPYVFREELLWPLLHVSRSVLAEVELTDYPAWLREVGNALDCRAQRFPVVPVTLAHALWAEWRADIRRAKRSPHADVREYGEALSTLAGPALHGPWNGYHRELEAAAVAELRRYAAQLRCWSTVVASLEMTCT